MTPNEKLVWAAAQIYLAPILLLAFSCALFGRMPPRTVVARFVMWPVFLLLWSVPQGFWIWPLMKWLLRQARFAAVVAAQDLDRSERLAEKLTGDAP